MIDKIMISLAIFFGGLLIVGTYELHLGSDIGFPMAAISIFGMVYAVPRIWPDPDYNDPYSFHIRDKSKYSKSELYDSNGKNLLDDKLGGK